jgi:hypothetical protein
MAIPPKKKTLDVLFFGGPRVEKLRSTWLWTCGVHWRDSYSSSEPQNTEPKSMATPRQKKEGRHDLFLFFGGAARVDEGGLPRKVPENLEAWL